MCRCLITIGNLTQVLEVQDASDESLCRAGLGVTDWQVLITDTHSSLRGFLQGGRQKLPKLDGSCSDLGTLRHMDQTGKDLVIIEQGHKLTFRSLEVVRSKGIPKFNFLSSCVHWGWRLAFELMDCGVL